MLSFFEDSIQEMMQCRSRYQRRDILNHILKQIRKRPIRTIKQIAAPIRGFVDDYAFMVRALLDLYEVTFESEWMAWAAELQRRQDELFWDQDGGGWKEWLWSRMILTRADNFLCYILIRTGPVGFCDYLRTWTKQSQNPISTVVDWYFTPL